MNFHCSKFALISPNINDELSQSIQVRANHVDRSVACDLKKLFPRTRVPNSDTNNLIPSRTPDAWLITPSERLFTLLFSGMRDAQVEDGVNNGKS
ncbi:hypothetical protein TNIN_65231 [Trichonephila inaurata madagascariensis]|uniref:Uncharacterized protein n=1 Tax=Trichonephila inaurata madagascariensis TaxID=2747483 RepID=A0A8X7C2W5_9ARAC|nr:hypothetical protein TNIN_65231 [Trichonephila inaurata madagascariensis]